MDKCQVCLGSSEHTHHIKEQQTADKNNNIDYHHKNINHNLVPLCEKCHYNVHHGDLIIYGYYQTNEGIKLNYEFIKNSNEKNSKKKLNKEQIEIILGYKNNIENKTIKKNQFIKKLELDYKIKISLGTLNKVLKNEY